MNKHFSWEIPSSLIKIGSVSATSDSWSVYALVDYRVLQPFLFFFGLHQQVQRLFCGTLLLWHRVLVSFNGLRIKANLNSYCVAHLSRSGNLIFGFAFRRFLFIFRLIGNRWVFDQFLGKFFRLSFYLFWNADRNFYLRSFHLAGLKSFLKVLVELFLSELEVKIFGNEAACLHHISIGHFLHILKSVFKFEDKIILNRQIRIIS